MVSILAAAMTPHVEVSRGGRRVPWLMRRESVGAIAAPNPFAILQASVGADLLGFYWFRTADCTVAAGLCTNVKDLGVALVNMDTPPFPRKSPAYNAAGGPNNEPYIELQDLDRVLRANVNYAAGHRVSVFLVCQLAPGNAGERAIIQAGHPAENLLYGRFGTGTMRRYSDFSTGAQDLYVPSGIANNLYTPWAVHQFMPLATGARSAVNGVNTVPNYAGSPTCRAWPWFTFGYLTFNVSGGRIACGMLVNNAGAHEAACLAFTQAVYGVG